ncbi:MAG: Fic family protein [Legionella sp.]|nr:Fic family protein [Legionella sp.]
MPYSKFEVKPTFADTKFLESYIYLFCIDMETEINHKRHYRHYLTRDEQGFTQSTLNAYIEAFLRPRGTLDNNLVLKLHGHIAAHLHTPGKYKTGCNKFAVLGKELPNRVSHTSATEQGLKEFIDRWMLNPTKATHLLIISPLDALDNPNYQGSLAGSMGLFNRSNDIWFSHISAQGRIQERYEHKKHLKLIWSALINPEYVCEINSMPDECIPQNQVAILSELLLKQVIDAYNKKIVLCRLAQDKIACIVELAQSVNQLHSFEDGNTRLALLLLNLLLHNQGLSMSLIANPNRLGMFSNAELVQSVIEGQYYFRELCEGRIPMVSDKWIKEKNYPFTPCTIESSAEQIQQFIKNVVHQNYQKAYHKPKIYSLAYSSNLFYPLAASKKSKTVLATDLSIEPLHWDNIHDTDKIRFVPELI